MMQPRKQRTRVRPFLERLEDRSLPSASTLGPIFAPDVPDHVISAATEAIPQPVEQSALLPTLAATTPQVVSTVPPNGDLNPYGVAFVPDDFAGGGRLHPGDILVSNFNDSANLQGTGTTIVQITPSGQQSVFFHGGSGLGLTTALGVLKAGFVLVGNVPTTDGTFGTIQQGSLLVLNRDGRLVTRLRSATKLDGPWDLAINDQGSKAQVFVSNVLSGTVTRIDLTIPTDGNPIVQSMTQIASGYAHRSDPAALVVGPTGLAYDATKDVLYVASTADNAIFAVPNAEGRQTDAGTGGVIFRDPARLRGPLGLVLAPNGDLITTNGDAVNGNKNFPSELVEFNPDTGKFVAQLSVDPAQGSAFGIALMSANGQLRFAAVNDDTNTLEVWTIAL
jgi:hypothetical protein